MVVKQNTKGKQFLKPFFLEKLSACGSSRQQNFNKIKKTAAQAVMRISD